MAVRPTSRGKEPSEQRAITDFGFLPRSGRQRSARRVSRISSSIPTAAPKRVALRQNRFTACSNDSCTTSRIRCRVRPVLPCSMTSGRSSACTTLGYRSRIRTGTSLPSTTEFGFETLTIRPLSNGLATKAFASVESSITLLTKSKQNMATRGPNYWRIFHARSIIRHTQRKISARCVVDGDQPAPPDPVPHKE